MLYKNNEDDSAQSSNQAVNVRPRGNRSADRRLWEQSHRARRKLLMIVRARDVNDLRNPPGSQLELLKGDRARQRSKSHDIVLATTVSKQIGSVKVFFRYGSITVTRQIAEITQLVCVTFSEPAF